jgi:hypothetical protein
MIIYIVMMQFLIHLELYSTVINGMIDLHSHWPINILTDFLK